MTNNLVLEDDLAVIFESLLRTQAEQDFIMMWQVSENGKRTVKNAFLLNIKVKEMCLHLQASDSHSLIFDKDLPLYIRCEDRGLLFKGSIININANELEVQLPREARVVELRSKYRNQMSRNPEVKIVVEKVNDAIVGKTRFDFIANNINESGIGVTFSVSKINSFTIGDKIKVRSIGRLDFKIPFLCEIVHITNGKGKSGMSARLCKMGLRFCVVIPEHHLLDIVETYAT